MIAPQDNDPLAQDKSLLFGEGKLEELGEILRRYDADRVLLVADEPAFQMSGAAERIAPILQSRQVFRFTDFQPNPDIGEVRRGVDLARQASPGCMVAIGGGTAIDYAKMICRFSPGSQAVDEHVIHCDPLPGGPPLVVVPTTAGTGSEATHFAVVYVEGQKHSVAHERLTPDAVILDPTLTYSMPPKVTASSGLDAFCQSVESIWAVGATSESIRYAAEALTLGLQNLAIAYSNPTPAARAGMCRAAYLAGCAINLTKTTAPHAISYALTKNLGVPHGFAVAASLSAMLRYNAAVSAADCQDPRGPGSVRERIDLLLDLLGARDIDAACVAIEEVIACVSGHVSLREAGLRSTRDVSRLLEQVNTERLSNNPRSATHQQLLAALC